MGSRTLDSRCSGCRSFQGGPRLSLPEVNSNGKYRLSEIIWAIPCGFQDLRLLPHGGWACWKVGGTCDYLPIGATQIEAPRYWQGWVPEHNQIGNWVPMVIFEMCFYDIFHEDESGVSVKQTNSTGLELRLWYEIYVYFTKPNLKGITLDLKLLIVLAVSLHKEGNADFLQTDSPGQWSGSFQGSAALIAVCLIRCPYEIEGCLKAEREGAVVLVGSGTGVTHSCGHKPVSLSHGSRRPSGGPHFLASESCLWLKAGSLGAFTWCHLSFLTDNSPTFF